MCNDNSSANGRNRHANRSDVIITGEWDGETIWRHKSTAEKLLEMVEANEKQKKPKSIDAKSWIKKMDKFYKN